jgi:soluble lytic murein transglycosylase-like protein
MRNTARDYGLEVSGSIDERTEVTKSSRAAARYMQHLVFEFGSDALPLALAGYNLGQGQVRARLRRLDDPFNDRSYWRLVETGLLPEETAVFVTRFVAAAIAGEGGLPSRATLLAAGY